MRVRGVRLALLCAAIAGCKGGGGAPRRDDEPVQSYELPTDGLDLSAFDFLAWLPTALAEARKHFPDAQLASLTAEGVSADGLLDLAGGAEVDYTFVSPSADPSACMFTISIDDVIEVGPGGGRAPCASPVRMPTCGGTELLERAAAAGVVVENAWIRVWYGGRENDQWRVHSEDRHSEDTQVTLDDDC